MEPDVVCPTPGCQTVLRKLLGIQQAGEPPIWSDQEGRFVRCPACSARVPWPPSRAGTVIDISE